jgi:YesN/AraC family two-component response regulator
MTEVKHDQSSYSLLLVEDDPIASSFISKAISLKFPGLRLLVAENGQRGLALYKEHRPEIVLTDIKMPVMDGITMSAEIKALNPKTIVTVISAYCDTQQYQTTAGEIGIDHCLTKPIDYKSLFQTIEKCLAEIESKK